MAHINSHALAPSLVPKLGYVVECMNDDINKVMAMPDVLEKFEQYGAEDGGGSIEKFATFIKAEQKKWAEVALQAKVKADA